MIRYFSDKLTNYLIKSQSIEEEKRSFYQYGLEITLSTMLNIVLILIISVFFGNIIDGLVFLFVFITLRHLTGGYHANSYFFCNFWFSVCYISLELLFSYTNTKLPILICVLITFLCLLIIALKCPIENPNKRIPPENRSKLKLMAIILAAVYEIIALLLQVFKNRYGVFILYTVLLVAILVIVATLQKILKGGKEYDSDTQNGS